MSDLALNFLKFFIGERLKPVEALPTKMIEQLST